jgi:hypothetical protein
MNEALTFNEDGTKRYPDIHWPDGFHPEQADLFAHNEIVVRASCKTVWDHIIEAEKWPSWYSNSHNMKLLNSADGKLHEDTRFSWDTFGLHVECRIGEFVASSRIGWFGDSNGANAYHTFLLLKVEGSVRKQGATMKIGFIGTAILAKRQVILRHCSRRRILLLRLREF